jgi:tRNA(fMet)-specific endonuclease VapC
MKRRYLLDTGATEDWMRPNSSTEQRAAEVATHGAVVGTCFPVLGEHWYGVENSASRERNGKRLERAMSKLIVWPFDEAAAREYGRVFTILKRVGRPMQQIDIQMAAIAMTLGNTAVVTKDSDLSAIPGLVVENWSLPPATA